MLLDSSTGRAFLLKVRRRMSTANCSQEDEGEEVAVVDTFKVALVGPEYSGKTSLAAAMTRVLAGGTEEGGFGAATAAEYDPTLLAVRTLLVGDQRRRRRGSVLLDRADSRRRRQRRSRQHPRRRVLRLDLWEAGGAPEFELARPLCFSGAAVVILCISLKDGNEDDTVAEWRKELEEKCHGVPVVIVGTKLDLPKDAATSYKVEEEEKDENGNPLVSNDFGLLRCSSATGEGVAAVLDAVVGVVARKVEEEEERLRKRSSSFSPLSCSPSLWRRQKRQEEEDTTSNQVTFRHQQVYTLRRRSLSSSTVHQQ